jgi:hypothetical protein
MKGEDMLEPNRNYVIEDDGSIHKMLFCGDADWEERATTSIQEIRAKAIDEFAKKLKTDVESFTAEVDGVRADLITLGYFSEFVFEVAEKLKGVQE